MWERLHMRVRHFTECSKEKGKSLMNRASSKVTSFQMFRALLGLLLLWASSPLLDAQTKGTTTLTVRVTGARNAKGKIGVTLFQDAQGFPDDTSKAIRQQSAEIDPKTMSAQITFKDVPQGTFAVAVLHDENSNGKMDKNFVGIPKEGYGASNNPQEEKTRAHVRRSEILFEQRGTDRRDQFDLLASRSGA
jgi:uncharacterized protein (DUF2141 family)